MIKVVVDTNLLLTSIPKSSKNRWLYDAFIRQKFYWVFSNDIISEYAEVIAREFSQEAADLVFSILLAAPNTIRQSIYFNWNSVEDDPDDNKFIDCAIAANADFLVTADRHLLNLKQNTDFLLTAIITPEDFRAYLMME